ncbi:MAG TPA: hypothetical protein PKA27_13845 [Fimbriimonadaceae bacterium]|nr:hypothetical protein [Fimbriimonadaceae bacterium]
MLVLALAPVCGPDLDWVVGSWKGTTQGSQFLSQEVSLDAAVADGKLTLVLTRNVLIQKLVDTVVVNLETNTATTSTPYVPAHRVDHATFSNKSLQFRADPWNIGMEQPLQLEWSLSSGRLEERPQKGRIFLAGPLLVEDANSLVFTWNAHLDQKPLGLETANLRRQP